MTGSGGSGHLFLDLLGKRVFYPIPFSQYNPDLIYGDHIPTLEKQKVGHNTE